PAAAVRDIEFMLAGGGMLRREPIAVSQHSYRRDTERAILSLERLLPYLLEEQAALERIAQRLERFDARQNLHRGNLGNRVMGLTTLDDPTTAGAAGVPSTLYAAWVRDNKHKVLETLRQLDETLASRWPAPWIAAQQ